MSNFERRVTFQPGYNYLHETGPKRRGQHGMQIRFLLIGDDGAAQFLMGTGWTPLGQVDANAPGSEPCHVDHWRSSIVGDYQVGTVNTPSGYDLGYHWKTPLYEGADGPQECDVLGGAGCYYDGSGIAADDVLRDFISEGEPAVWRWLEKRYQWCLDEAATFAAEATP